MSRFEQEIREAVGRLHVLWIQKVHKRSGRFDSFNDPVFEPINLDEPPESQRGQSS